MSNQLSKTQRLQEILHAGKDPVYFIKNYCKISHPLRGLIPFRLYNFQEDVIRDFNDYRFNVINKARQLGLSSSAAAYVAWMLLFHREKNVLVVATKLSTATNLVKKVKFIFKNLPSWMMISKIEIDNRTSFELANGSQIKASSTSGDAGRSEALTLLVVDEASFVEGMDEMWAGLYPTLSTGGRCIALSSPNGVGNWFHKTFTEAEEGKNDFNCVTLPWNVHPERNQEWFEKETRNMSRREIAQELECSFNQSGEGVFHPDCMEKIRNTVHPPLHKTGVDRNFWIWEGHQDGAEYLLVGDVARGDGKDHSAFHIWRLDTFEQVAEYQGKPNLDDYSNIIYNASKEYGFCLTVVENNSLGIAVLEKLKDLDHPNLYYSIKGTHQYVDKIQAEAVSNSIIGFSTTPKTRPLIIAKLEEFVRNKLIKINSQRLYNEMTTFIWNNGRAEAQRSYNDDLVISTAIGCWVRDTALVVNQRELEYRKAMLSSMSVSSGMLDSRIPGMTGYRATQDSFAPNKNKESQAYSQLQYPALLKG